MIDVIEWATDNFRARKLSLEVKRMVYKSMNECKLHQHT